MIPRIKEIKPLDNYMLYVVFDDGKSTKLGNDFMDDDDEFCENLYQHYLNSEDKDECYTLEECKKSGILKQLSLMN